MIRWYTHKNIPPDSDRVRFTFGYTANTTGDEVAFKWMSPVALSSADSFKLLSGPMVCLTVAVIFASYFFPATKSELIVTVRVFTALIFSVIVRPSLLLESPSVVS